MKTWTVPMEFTYHGTVTVTAKSAKEAIMQAEGQHWDSDDLKTLIDWGTLGGAEEDV